MRNELITTRELAAWIHKEPQTIRLWRIQGRGPRFIRLGPNRRGRVAYDPADVQAWLDSSKYGSTSEETCKSA